MIFNGKTNSFNVESLEGQSHAKAMRESCQKIQDDIGKRIFASVSHAGGVDSIGAHVRVEEQSLWG